MGNLEERGSAECLCEFGAQAGKAGIVQKNIALDLAGNVFHCAGVAETQCLSPFLKGIVYVEELCEWAGIDCARP